MKEQILIEVDQQRCYILGVKHCFQCAVRVGGGVSGSGGVSSSGGVNGDILFVSALLSSSISSTIST